MKTWLWSNYSADRLYFILHMTLTFLFQVTCGKYKMAQRILQRFYWPTLYRDVEEYCRTCEPCQISSHSKTRRASRIPMPVFEQPFSRRAMDIIGPLPRRHSGKQNVLVMCDYATRYPEETSLLTELYRLLHIQPIRTSPYHPQTDGVMERFNQTLKSMLRKAAVEEGKDWDKLIPFLLFTYRELPQASTQLLSFPASQESTNAEGFAF